MVNHDHHRRALWRLWRGRLARSRFVLRAAPPELVNRTLDGASPGLRAAMCEVMPSVTGRVAGVLDHLPDDDWPMVDGLFLPDALVADYCDGFGVGGQRLAARMRESSAARVRHLASGDDFGSATLELVGPWVADGLPPALRAVVNVVMGDAIDPRLRQPALSLTVLTTVSRSLLAPRRELTVDDTGRVLRRGVEVLAPGVAPEVVPSLLRAAGSLTGHRLLRFLVERAYFSRYIEKNADYRRIVIRGGYGALARQLGLTGGKHAVQVHNALRAFQGLHVDLPLVRSRGLITFTEHGPARRPSQIAIVVGDPLLPGFGDHLPKGNGSRRDAKALVPIPGELPRLPKAPRNHAAAAALQLRVLAQLRLHAETLVSSGGVKIPWTELARDVGLSPTVRDEVVELWTEDHEDRFLVPVGGDRVTLASPRYAAELEMLLEAGRRSARGREAQAKRRRGRS